MGGTEACSLGGRLQFKAHYAKAICQCKDEGRRANGGIDCQGERVEL